jgi:hypothetical protein
MSKANEGMSVWCMSGMRLIKRCGSKLSDSDRAYVLFNSYEKVSVMGYVERFKRCSECGEKASEKGLWWVVVDKDTDFDAEGVCWGGIHDVLEICSGCIKKFIDDDYDVCLMGDDDIEE